MLPAWFHTHNDARLTGTRVHRATCVDEVPIHVRRQARMYDRARQEAAIELNKRAKTVLFKVEV